MKTINVVFNSEEREFKVLPDTHDRCEGCVAIYDKKLCDVLCEQGCYEDRTIFQPFPTPVVSEEAKQRQATWKEKWDAELSVYWVQLNGEYLEMFKEVASDECVARPNRKRVTYSEYNEYKRHRS